MTTSLTLAIVTVVGGGIYFRHDAARIRLEAQYSRLSAHFAEEADLRIESYRRAASVIGGVESWRESRHAQEASAKAGDAFVTKSQAVAKTSAEAAAKKSELKSTALSAIAARTSAEDALGSARAADGRADEAVRARGSALQDAKQAVAREKAALDGASASRSSGRDGGAPIAPDPGTLQKAKQALETAQQRLTDEQTKYDRAATDSFNAHIAAITAQDALTTLAKSEAAAIGSFSAADRSAANAQQALAKVTKELVQEAQQRATDAKKLERQSLLSFLPSSAECENENPARFNRCYAQALVEILFKVPVQDLPEVVPCQRPEKVQAVDDSEVLISGRNLLFRIPHQTPAAPENSTNAPEASKRPVDDKKLEPGQASDLCLRVRVDELVPFAPSEASGDRADVQNAFAEVLLVDAKTCRVLEWSDTDPQVRLATRPDCVAAMAAKVPKPASSAETSPDDAKMPAPSAPEAANVDVAGQRYRAFSQPIRSSFRCAAGEGKDDAGAETTCSPGRSLVVVGLVQGDRIIEQVRGLSPLVFLMVVALAALALFSWPVAKLWLVGARSRFNRFDTAFLATSALAGTFIVVLVALAMLARERLNRRLDDQLGAVATEVATRLDAAMENASENLKQFVERTTDVRDAMTAAGASGSSDFDVPPAIDEACAKFADAVSGSSEASVHDLQWPHPEDPKRHFPICEAPMAHRMTVGGGANGSMAFWANDGGYIQIQQSDTKEGTPPVNVARRDYFRRARAGCTGGNTTPPDTAEVVRSLTSTKKVLVVSRPVTPCAKDSDGGNTASVAGFETDLFRFERLGLPSGMQWAAIDFGGKVMLHSSIDDHHGHDFLDDVDGATANRLRAAMFARATAHFDGEYRGVRSRFDVRADPASGWFVVAMGSRGMNEAITRDTLITASAVYGGFVLLMALFVVGCALYRFSTSDNTQGFHVLDPRPRGDSSREYAAAFVRVGVGSAVLFALTLICPWIPTLPLLLAAAALLVLSARKIPGVWPSPVPTPPAVAKEKEKRKPALQGPRTWRDRLALTYALCCFGHAAGFVVVPTTVCFVGAFSIAARSALRVEERALSPEPGCADAIKPLCTKPIRDLEPVRAPPMPPGTRSSGYASIVSPDMLWPLEPLMGWFRPDYLVAAREPFCGETGGRCLRWVDDVPEIRTEPVPPKIRAEPVPKETRSAPIPPEEWSLVSTVPHLLGHLGLGQIVVGIGTLLVLLLVAHAIAYSSLKRLFFMDTMNERNAARANDSLPAGSNRTLFFFPPPELVPDPNISDPKTVVLRAGDAWSSPDTLIAKVKAAKLVFTEVDPLRRGTPELQERWAEALKDFDVLSGPGRPPSDVARGDPPNRAAFAYEWSLCDPDERRVLAQLALDGHASPDPSTGPVLRHLAGRGLVDDNTLSLAHPAFARFLTQSVSPEQMRTWEASETDVAWVVVRVPLLASVALIIGLVLMSHPELAESGALLLPPVAGGLPMVLRFVAMLAGKGKSDELTG